MPEAEQPLRFRGGALGSVERGRAAYSDRAWASAAGSLLQTDESTPLGAGDLELLATSLYMLGRMDEALGVLERAHEAYLDDGEPLRAVRCACYLGVNLALRGELGRATGWFGRAQRLVERVGRDCAERGYLMMPVALQREAAGDYEGACAAASAAAQVGERFREWRRGWGSSTRRCSPRAAAGCRRS